MKASFSAAPTQSDMNNSTASLDLLRAWAPIIGALISGGATVAIGLFITHRLTYAAKQTDMMVTFARRFGEVCEHQDKFNDAGDHTHPSEIDSRQAGRIYREYFTLLFDEFYAFQKGFLDPDVFSLWMAYCVGDGAAANLYRFDVTGFSYAEAWERFKHQAPLAGHEFVSFLDKVHQCTEPRAVRRIVSKFRHSPVGFGKSG